MDAVACDDSSIGLLEKSVTWTSDSRTVCCLGQQKAETRLCYQGGMAAAHRDSEGCGELEPLITKISTD